ncbi:hypothetical protein ABQE44_06605 [Mycolicibacterium sp. XJ2546]
MTVRTAAVPGGIDEIDADWLTEALRVDAGISDATVAAVRAEQIALDTGFSSLVYRLHLIGAAVPATLIGLHADNLFFAGDETRALDFQFATRGAGAADVAYLVTQRLPAQARDGHDAALLREYLDQVAALGVTDYTFDEAWRQYRFAAGYPMVLPVITLNGWDALPDRSRRLCLTLTDRAVAAIEEIGALEVFA